MSLRIFTASWRKRPPKAAQATDDELLARIALFPRIAASCLVTTVMEAEKKSGFPFARYAGTGFADFTYPASQPPEDDIEAHLGASTSGGRDPQRICSNIVNCASAALRRFTRSRR